MVLSHDGLVGVTEFNQDIYLDWNVTIEFPIWIRIVVFYYMPLYWNGFWNGQVVIGKDWSVSITLGENHNLVTDRNHTDNDGLSGLYISFCYLTSLALLTANLPLSFGSTFCCRFRNSFRRKIK